MRRDCDQCGAVYEAKRKTSRFCSDRCKVRAVRARAAAGRPLQSVGFTSAAAITGVAPVPAEARPAGAVLEATTRHLEAAGRLDTPLGQAALVLARRLDDGAMESGSALAALARQLTSTVEAATKGAATVETSAAAARRELLERRRARQRDAEQAGA